MASVIDGGGFRQRRRDVPSSGGIPAAAQALGGPVLLPVEEAGRARAPPLAGHARRGTEVLA